MHAFPLHVFRERITEGYWSWPRPLHGILLVRDQPKIDVADQLPSYPAGLMTRDPRRVERKKPGKLKARKMPAWVKR